MSPSSEPHGNTLEGFFLLGCPAILSEGCRCRMSHPFISRIGTSEVISHSLIMAPQANPEVRDSCGHPKTVVKQYIIPNVWRSIASLTGKSGQTAIFVLGKCKDL